jgi:hypothetical protein
VMRTGARGTTLCVAHASAEILSRFARQFRQLRARIWLQLPLRPPVLFPILIVEGRPLSGRELWLLLDTQRTSCSPAQCTLLHHETG